MSRIFHWGPLIAISIIKFVSLTTLYYFGKWSIPLWDLKSLLNLCPYCFLIFTTLYNLFIAIFNGPGYVPKNWRPANAEDEQFLQYCYRCESFKAPRSHHCSKCNRCILKMDHHCPWINNCCGYRNQKNFLYFLLSAVIGSIHSSILLAISLYRAIYFIPNVNNKYIYITVQGLFCILLSVGLCIGVIIAVGGLLFIQTRILIRNRTTIEDWILTKANSRKRETSFVFPYNLGLLDNIKEVLFKPLSDGIVWPVKNGCNQYTLTHEQILQKKEKLNNSTLVRIVSPYNGRFFPLFSQGIRVCLSFPINDDPRLQLEVGEEVLVTHWNKRWLYGQKITKNPKERIKGWFPEKCAVVLIMSNSMDTKECRFDDRSDNSGDYNDHEKKE